MALQFATSPALPQADYPAKPIRAIQTLCAGGGADALARLVAQRLSETMGQPVIVEAQGEINRVVTQPQLAERFADLGFVVETANPEQFAVHIKASLELFGRAVKAANIQPE